jgi:hypothetical protein
MEISQFKKLLNNLEYLEFESYIKAEILKAERKAISSIHTDEIDKESANRAKFYQEIIDIPRNKVNAGKMSENKTKL